RLSNAAAIALYRAEGFAPVARRAGYYPAADGAGAREDALVLRRGVRLGAATDGSRDHRG
ncbi:MAG TPA: ribosomal-protein-alanine N-acetyltransferase, partial [Casimicrobiaceae bacterium]